MAQNLVSFVFLFYSLPFTITALLFPFFYNNTTYISLPFAKTLLSREYMGEAWYGFNTT